MLFSFPALADVQHHEGLLPNDSNFKFTVLVQGSRPLMTASPPPSVTWPPSLWAATAPAGPILPALDGDQTTDAVIIGAGFTGLSTAIHLREAGVAVIVIEAAEPGWGASGRNNGQVIPTLAGHDPS